VSWKRGDTPTTQDLNSPSTHPTRPGSVARQTIHSPAGRKVTEIDRASNRPATCTPCRFFFNTIHSSLGTLVRTSYHMSTFERLSPENDLMGLEIDKVTICVSLSMKHRLLLKEYFVFMRHTKVSNLGLNSGGLVFTPCRFRPPDTCGLSI
jgi:hypothetical protein